MTTSRDRSAVARRLLAAALTVLMSGCSFVSVQRPRPPTAVEDPRVLDDCTTTSQAPIADTVLAAAGLVAGYVAMLVSIVESADCVGTTSSCDSGSPAPGIALFGAGALYTGSAVYGYVSTAQCRRRVVAGGRCANGDVAACLKLSPGWSPPPGWRGGPTLAPRPPPDSPTAPAPRPAEWTEPAPSTTEWPPGSAQPAAPPEAPAPPASTPSTTEWPPQPSATQPAPDAL